MLNETYDVLIIGSGHAGGMAAKILTEYGIRCLMLNAGPVADVSHDAEKKPAFELPFRGFRPPGRLEHVFQSNEFNANVWVDEQEVPYTFEDGPALQLGAGAVVWREVVVLVAAVVPAERLRVQGEVA